MIVLYLLISLSKKRKKKSNSIFENQQITTKTIQNLPSSSQTLSKLNCQKIGNPSMSEFKNFFNIYLPNSHYKCSSNPFFDAFFLAYYLHGELVLSPDDIWLQISSQLGKYIDENAEKLREKIVFHDGKKDLAVLYNITDQKFLDHRNENFRWDIILKGFSKLIKENTKGEFVENFECNFSTTKTVALASSHVALMQATKKYFNNKMGGGGRGVWHYKNSFFGRRKRLD